MIDLPAAVSRLPVRLQPGGLAVNGDGGGVVPILWRSDARPTADLLRLLRAAHPESGLWPLLLDVEPLDLADLGSGTPDADDAGLLLAGFWRQATRNGPSSTTAPFGQRWPRTAPPGRPVAEPNEHADVITHELLDERRPRSQRWRLGLVPVSRSADVPAVIGWLGAVNYDNNTTKYAAILRSWEDRFGIRLVGMDQATLTLSVAAPPADLDTATHLAAEHFAFCPDQLWQGHPHTIGEYAHTLLDATSWTFWWD